MALVATGFSYQADRRAAQGALIAALLPRVQDVRRVGSAALDLCMVAAGMVDAHVEHALNPWDWAAGALIAAEAGAVGPDTRPDVTQRRRVPDRGGRSGIADEFFALLGELGGLDPL